jgi:inward rectifier potassium channel
VATPARFLSRDGRSTLALYGLRWHFYSDVYHRWLSAPWRLALGFVVLSYLSINLLFAMVYLLIGGIENMRPGSFGDAFFFSVQTIATIGYGKMVPISTAANLVVTLETLVGLLGLTLVTGLMFAKFARPTARVLWSEVAVVSPFEGVPSLMFRMANQRGNQVVEAQLRVAMLITETTAEGASVRRAFDLRLVRSQSTVFALSWTAIHPLTPDSPMVTHTPAQLTEGRAEIIASLTGLDDAFNQIIHSRHSWNWGEIVWNARFADLFGALPDGRYGLNYELFHQTVPLASPAQATASKPAS